MFFHSYIPRIRIVSHSPTDLLDERNQHDRLPFLLFTIEISQEVHRVVVDNRRRIVYHQTLKGKHNRHSNR